MHKKYYSQNGEDKFLDSFILNNSIHVHNKIIEIGALTGTYNSNSRFFIEHYNWEGIMIEPNPYSFTELVNNTKNINVILENVAISNQTGTCNFQTDTVHPGHSKISDKGNVKVKSIKFDEIFKKHPQFLNFDILSIDVEGNEIPILQDLMKYKIFPTFIISEHFTDNLRDIQNSIICSEYNILTTISYNTIWKRK